MNYIPLKGIEIVHLFEYFVPTLGEQFPYARPCGLAYVSDKGSLLEKAPDLAPFSTGSPLLTRKTVAVRPESHTSHRGPKWARQARIEGHPATHSVANSAHTASEIGFLTATTQGIYKLSCKFLYSGGRDRESRRGPQRKPSWRGPGDPPPV